MQHRPGTRQWRNPEAIAARGAFANATNAPPAGRDFYFVGSEFPVQVGARDFALDLLFFHCGLNCLVSIELKVGRFEPKYLGKAGFYVEALDRDVKKTHENPTIGVLLCASKSKNDEAVEYALQPHGEPGADRAVPHSAA